MDDIQINGRRYEIVIGTDVARPEARDGAFVEMWALDSPDTKFVLQAFRWNKTGAITSSAFRRDVPLEVLKYFLQVAEEVFAEWPRWGDLRSSGEPGQPGSESSAQG
jgi:hypothetical protein